MIQLPDKEMSYWQSTGKSSFPKLKTDLETDVIVIGGGISGLTTAYLLQKSGLRVIVLEKNAVGSGTTSHTTGKVTSQHSLMYAALVKRLGNKRAGLYAQASQMAVDRIARLIRDEKIDCDWEVDDNYVYTTDPNKVSLYKHEAKAAARLGLPASFETKSGLPYKIKAAVKFSNQGKFNAQKYVIGLADRVNGKGSYVFEHSNVVGIHDGQPAIVRTKTGSVTAKHIVVATKIPPAPLIARAGYALLEYPHTSYIVAGRFDRSLKGMYISTDNDHYSILPVKKGRERLLLIGGEHHIPGLSTAGKRYRRLAEYAETHFGIPSIDYKWKGMDYLAYDNVPLFGKVYPWSESMYTITGLKKWGLSLSMAGATILHDEITGKSNPWASVFVSTRSAPITSIPRAILKSVTG